MEVEMTANRVQLVLTALEAHVCSLTCSLAHSRVYVCACANMHTHASMHTHRYVATADLVDRNRIPSSCAEVWAWIQM